MSKHFGSSPEIYEHSSSKAVFLPQKRQTYIFCELCQMCDKQSSYVSEKQIKRINNQSLKYSIKKNGNLIKLNKKSLKVIHKFEDQLIRNNSMQPIEQNLLSQKIQKSTNINSQIHLNSNVFKKTQSSDKGNYLSQGSVYFSYQQKKPKLISHSSSCINLKNHHLQKSIKAQNHYGKIQKISNDPVGQQLVSHNKSPLLPNTKINGNDQNKSYQNMKVRDLRFKSSVSQNLSSLQISPIRYLPIPQQTQRSAFVSDYRNNDQTTINKLLDLQSRQNFSKSSLQDVSNRTFKTYQNNNNLQQNMIKPFCQKKVLPVIPQISKQLSLKSESNQDYLEISFEQIQQLKKNKIEDQNVCRKKVTNNKNEKIQNNLENSNEFQIKVISQKVLQSDVGTNLNQPEQTKIAQSHNTKIEKNVKISLTHTFGRYSVQIPKSKNFYNFKVRRTISMKDQQDSSQEETSEVIYGFRNLNNLVVMEDIAQDMQQSYMTKWQTNIDSIEKLSLRQF